MKRAAAEQAARAAGGAETAEAPERAARGAAENGTGTPAARRAAPRGATGNAAGRPARRAGRIAAAEEILEYLTGVMREGDTKDGFHAAELLGRHYSLFSDSARGEGTAVTIINDVNH